MEPPRDEVKATAPRWHRVTALFDALLDATPSERERALGSHPDADPTVVSEVRSLLSAHDAVDDRFEGPAWANLSVDFVGALSADQSLPPAHRVGAYEVVRKIGEGGMGTVYEAVRADDTYRQRVAIKTISRGADSGAIAARFRRERQILAALQHPNIALLLDGGVTAPTRLHPGIPYFVMEYVDGLPIHEWCRAKRLTLSQRLDLVQQVCAAVQHAHRRLVVHRDLKPQNVFVSNDGVVKLLDFGIAKLTDASPDSDPGAASLTEDGLTPMTTAYASPEQLRGEAVSTASDVYALGVLLYELLAGTLPFPAKGRSISALREAVLTEAPRAPSATCTDAAASETRFRDRAELARALTGDLDAIVLMAMRKEPERRYSSAEALASDIVRHLQGHTISAQPDTMSYRVQRFVGRHRASVVMGALLVFVAMTSFALILRQSNRTRSESERTARISAFMQDVLGAADATALGGAVPRMGPNASVSMLLDSALYRVPERFPNDPAIRARLYLTFGSALIAQSRMRAASAILDSAVTLTRAEYGETNELYARACLEAAEAAIHRNRVAEARAYVILAQRVVDALGQSDSELSGRVLREFASIALVDNDYEGMARYAQAALDVEDRRTQSPTLTKAVALNRLGSAAFAQGRVAKADSLYGQSVGMMDAVGATSNLERLDIDYNLASMAMQRGRLSQADSIISTSMRIVERTYGGGSREVALLLCARSSAAMARGDTVAADADSRAALRIIDSIPDVAATVQTVAYLTNAAVATRKRDWVRADSMLRLLLAELQHTTRGLPLLYTLVTHATVLLRQANVAEADSQLTRALQAYHESHVELPAILASIRMGRAEVEYRRGDSVAFGRAIGQLAAPQAEYLRKFLGILPTSGQPR